jgi:hypothetical protein
MEVGRGGQRDNQDSEMTPDRSSTLEDRGTERGTRAPASHKAYAANQKYREGKSNQEDPESEVGSRGVPVDDALRSVRRLELLRLQATHDERRHEESSRNDQHGFQGGEGGSQAFHEELYSTQYFVLQSSRDFFEFLPRRQPEGRAMGGPFQHAGVCS